jgi:hypothetical protein
MGTSLRWFIACADHHSNPAAATGPKACNCKEPARSPVRAALVARLRKQVGQGMPVKARSGQEKPGSAGWSPFNQA